jgi:hypothetical protein
MYVPYYTVSDKHTHAVISIYVYKNIKADVML